MPRKGENIYKRKDNRWEGRYIKEKSNNKIKYGYVYAHSYREVKNKLNEAKLIIREKTAIPPNQQEFLLKTIADEWFEFIQPQVKESTSIKYNNLLQTYIFPKLGTEKIKDISNDKLELFCNELLTTGGKKENGLSSKTVADILSLIRNILKFASKKGIIVSYDMCSVKIKQNTKEMNVFSSLEQEKLYQYLFSNLNNCNAGIILCLFTGIRIGELCALHWKDVSLSEKTIYIHQTMQRIQCKEIDKKTKILISTPKSKCSIRIIPLPDSVVELIKKDSITKSGYFLTGQDDKFIEPRTMQYLFKKILKELSISDKNFHALRHTFATRCIELGFDVKSLSEILGHASVNITMNRYVHPSMELKRENMQRLSELLAVK